MPPAISQMNPPIPNELKMLPIFKRAIHPIVMYTMEDTYFGHMTQNAFIIIPARASDQMMIMIMVPSFLGRTFRHIGV